MLEIATPPAPDTPTAGTQLRGAARQGRGGGRAARPADRLGGHASVRPLGGPRVVGEERYRELVSTLGFVARRELIFGMHVHVGLDDPETAIHVANGVREHVPLLLALSANSPFWRGEATGLASSRMPIFRGFPRVGIPPAYDGWADFERRIETMVAAGLIEDYTWMWYDVRPHPNLGTVEVRAMDAQTRVEHTLGLAALIQALVRELAEGYAAGERSTPTAASCSTRTAGSRPATASTASWSTSPERAASARASSRGARGAARAARRGSRFGGRSGWPSGT